MRYKIIFLLFILSFCCTHLRALAQGTGELPSGNALIDSLRQRLSHCKEDSNKIKLLSRISFLHCEQDPGKGLFYGRQSLALAEKLQWQYGLAISCNAMGVNEQNVGNNRSAMTYFVRALQIYKVLNNKRGIARSTGNIAGVYCAESNYVKALENWLEALKEMEALADTVGIANQLGNIALVYQEIGNYAKALEYSNKAMIKYKEIGDIESEAMQLGNIANTLDKMGQASKALEAYGKSLAIYEAIGNKEGIARSLMNVSTTYSNSKQDARALECQFRSLELYKEIGDRDCIGTAYANLGDYYFSIARDTGKMITGKHIPANRHTCLELAMKYLTQSIELHKETNNLTMLAFASKKLAYAQMQAGNNLDALKSYMNYALYKDSVFSIENNKHIADMELKRELELKDKQIELDRLAVEKKRNERYFFFAGLLLLAGAGGILFRNMKLANARELSENKLSAFQARMNPHFIFNSLNSIQSLVLHNETIPSIRYLNEFSTLMRQILDNSAKSKVQLKTEIQMLQSYIALEQLRYDNFKWAINIADDVYEGQVFVPGMIVQPFVENSIVHGFQPERKDWELTITFERIKQQIICTVDDNGIGRAKSAELKLARDNERQSHGISIATSRLSLLNNRKKGLVNTVVYNDKMENGIATGTRVTIQIPIL